MNMMIVASFLMVGCGKDKSLQEQLQGIWKMESVTLNGKETKVDIFALKAESETGIIMFDKDTYKLDYDWEKKEFKSAKKYSLNGDEITVEGEKTRASVNGDVLEIKAQQEEKGQKLEIIIKFRRITQKELDALAQEFRKRSKQK